MRQHLTGSIAEGTFALGEHLLRCQAARGRWFAAAAWAERMHRRVAPRFVTTVVVVSVLLAGASGWL